MDTIGRSTRYDRFLRQSPRANLGAVKIYVASPTRVLLVRDDAHERAVWKLPGGSIELTDADVIDAARRELREETGLEFNREKIELRLKEQRTNRSYRPHFCIARTSEEKIDTRIRFGDENGRKIMTGLFRRDEVPMMLDLLEQHRPFIREAEGLVD